MISFSTLASVLGIMFLIGSVLMFRAYTFSRTAKRVRARIVSRAKGTRLDPGLVRTWRFVVEVRDQKGALKQVALAESIGAALIDKLVGQDGTIAVRYNPAKPDTVHADSPFITYMIGAYLCAPGLLFLMVCLWMWMTT